MPTTYRTCLERQMYGYLIELGFESGTDFYEQYPFGSYVLDFAFVTSRKPFRGIDFETDGIQWHSDPKQKKRDLYRNYKLLKGGWQIERFGETFSLKDVKGALDKYGLKPS